ncbi:RidA family protein [Rhodococcus coprophilus]|nr:RidA family protein [Rhodococcus coprophilus]MBM7458556.1 enamine deaminase RidA (YjgF/YER057c/UK114 family) [Rhodococcus coprophilus]
MSNEAESETSSTPAPQGRYVAAVLAGGTIRTAGMTPRRNGTLTVTGKVGADLTVAEARTAAALAVRNALSAVQSVLPSGKSFRPVEMVVYVAAADGFTTLSAVADGASDVIAEELGPENLPARSAIGVYTLPGGAPVEISLTATVR